MLDGIIADLKRTVTDAFVNAPPEIPWLKTQEDPQVVNLRDIYAEIGDFPMWPTIFVAPSIEFPEDVEIPERDDQIEEEIRESGTDALAWYVSFHQSSRWGIYFRARGIFFLSSFFKTRTSVQDLNERVKLAFDLLLYHELFHFLTDMTAAHMEMVYKKPTYNDYLRFVSTSPPEGVLVEEPLANAYVLRRMPQSYHPKIKRFFTMQPSSYRRYREFFSDIDFTRGKRKLGAIIHLHDITLIAIQKLERFPKENEPFWEFIFNAEPEVVLVPQIPTYIVNERHVSCNMIKFMTPVTDGVQVAAYPCDHPPSHIHAWIPAHNKKDGRYLYPSLEPYMGAPPLSNKKRRKLEDHIRRYRPKIERRFLSLS